MRSAVLTLALAMLAVSAAVAQAADPATPSNNPAAPNQAGAKQPYLGVLVERLPEALASQLATIVPQGEGVLVVRVERDSPAAKAKLVHNDILLSYGDEKLASPEALVKAVSGDKAGHEVELRFVRAGKTESAKVNLGEREARRTTGYAPGSQDPRQEVVEESAASGDNSAWQTLDGLKLTRLDAHRWRAEIDFRTTAGKTEHKQFEGTRAEIRKDVIAETDLPANERNHLLRAISFSE